MTELAIELKVQEVIQGLSEFADADVVINDWRIFDKPSVSAPYVLIEASDDFESLHEVMTPESRWGVPINLIEAFSDWKETYDAFRDRRQALLNAFVVGDARAAAGLNIERIYNDGSITSYFDRTIPPELLAEALPIFITQRIILEAREY